MRYNQVRELSSAAQQGDSRGDDEMVQLAGGSGVFRELQSSKTTSWTSKLIDLSSSYDPMGFLSPLFLYVLFVPIDVYDFNSQTADSFCHSYTEQVKLGLSNAYILIL